MQGLIFEEARKIRNQNKTFSNLKDDDLFSLVCFKYFYNHGELTVSDFKSIFTRWYKRWRN